MQTKNGSKTHSTHDPVGRKYEKAPKKGPINVLLDRQFRMLIVTQQHSEIANGNQLLPNCLQKGINSQTKIHLINPQEPGVQETLLSDYHLKQLFLVAGARFELTTFGL